MRNPGATKNIGLWLSYRKNNYVFNQHNALKHHSTLFVFILTMAKNIQKNSSLVLLLDELCPARLALCRASFCKPSLKLVKFERL